MVSLNVRQTYESNGSPKRPLVIGLTVGASILTVFVLVIAVQYYLHRYRPRRRSSPEKGQREYEKIRSFALEKQHQRVTSIATTSKVPSSVTVSVSISDASRYYSASNRSSRFSTPEPQYLSGNSLNQQQHYLKHWQSLQSLRLQHETSSQSLYGRNQQDKLLPPPPPLRSTPPLRIRHQDSYDHNSTVPPPPPRNPLRTTMYWNADAISNPAARLNYQQHKKSQSVPLPRQVQTQPRPERASAPSQPRPQQPLSPHFLVTTDSVRTPPPIYSTMVPTAISRRSSSIYSTSSGGSIQATPPLNRTLSPPSPPSPPTPPSLEHQKQPHKPSGPSPTLSPSTGGLRPLLLCSANLLSPPGDNIQYYADETRGREAERSRVRKNLNLRVNTQVGATRTVNNGGLGGLVSTRPGTANGATATRSTSRSSRFREEGVDDVFVGRGCV